MFIFYPDTKHPLPQKESNIMPRYQSRTTSAQTEKLIHLSAPSISHWITKNVCQMHLNPESLLLCPAFQLCLRCTAWNELGKSVGEKKNQFSSIFSVYKKECRLQQRDGTYIGIHSADLFMCVKLQMEGNQSGSGRQRGSFYSHFVIFFPILATWVANTGQLTVIIAGLNRVIITEKWQTIISFCMAAWQRQRGLFRIQSFIRPMVGKGKVFFLMGVRGGHIIFMLGFCSTI